MKPTQAANGPKELLRTGFLLLAGLLLSVSALAGTPAPALTNDPAVIPAVYTAAHCNLWGTQPTSDALKETKDAYQEIGASCDGILVVQDATDIVKDTWQRCCRTADTYLKMKPYPSDPDERVRYRVSLALDICDGLNTHQTNYEANLCMMEMLFRIDDPRVHAIADECSPIGHHVGGDKGGRRKGGGGGDAADASKAKGGGDEKPQAKEIKVEEHEPRPHASGAAAWMASATGGKKGGTSDLMLNDESFSACQHKMLKAFLSEPAESKQRSMQ